MGDLRYSSQLQKNASASSASCWDNRPAGLGGVVAQPPAKVDGCGDGLSDAPVPVCVWRRAASSPSEVLVQ